MRSEARPVRDSSPTGARLLGMALNKPHLSKEALPCAIMLATRFELLSKLLLSSSMASSAFCSAWWFWPRLRRAASPEWRSSERSRLYVVRR